MIDLPINRPVCPVFNNQRDGLMRYRIAPSRANYFPNRFGVPKTATEAEGGFISYAEKIQAMKVCFYLLTIGKRKGLILLSI
jgi:catalase